MTAILDTSFLFALTDRSDRNHQRVLTVAQNTNERLVLPVVVLPEICYLVASRLGHQAMRRFVASMTPDAVQIESLTPEDLTPSIVEIFRLSVPNTVIILSYYPSSRGKTKPAIASAIAFKIFQK
ncbi:PIN domain-containing protein [Spirulina subsalsa FACHB-351]|uniref:PIN domain-containing protein n=1 Tax=Spirulina subsalsa FACHB-351 TaxID=234711 RepID=A0ABT3L684_9CYAN|nr:PIN domain-containing protein [Spirulina subsalsa]MCW6037012.1 PIN domain-containing protein [Spirulina subsalsa FACHB-351]